ncbi:unnamed protein product [Ixodes pacificus]
MALRKSGTRTERARSRSNIDPQAPVRRRCLHEVSTKIRLRKDLETGAQVKNSGWNRVIVRVSNQHFCLFGSGQGLRFSVQFRGSASESCKKGSNRFEKARTGRTTKVLIYFLHSLFTTHYFRRRTCSFYGLYDSLLI